MDEGGIQITNTPYDLVEICFILLCRPCMVEFLERLVACTNFVWNVNGEFHYSFLMYCNMIRLNYDNIKGVLHLLPKNLQN